MFSCKLVIIAYRIATGTATADDGHTHESLTFLDHQYSTSAYSGKLKSIISKVRLFKKIFKYSSPIHLNQNTLCILNHRIFFRISCAAQFLVYLFEAY